MLKAAIIGFGYMGEIRAKVVADHPELELRSVCDVSDAKLELARKILPPQVVVSKDLDSAFSAEIDIIFVCTPNHLIPDFCVRALNLGKNVFCEKPPGRSVQDIERMRGAEKENPNSKLMFGFNHRFHPGVLRARKILESGRLGKILWLRGLYGKSGGKSYPHSWRNSREISGGGILLDQGIHMIDLFHSFVGPFAESSGFIGNLYWKIPVEDNAMVVFENARGQQAFLHSSATFWKHRFELEIGCESGYLIIRGLLSKTGSYGRETLVIGRQEFEDEAEAIGNPSEEIIMFDKDKSWEIEVSKFVDHIRSNTPVIECSSTDALYAMEAVHRIYESQR